MKSLKCSSVVIFVLFVVFGCKIGAVGGSFDADSGVGNGVGNNVDTDVVENNTVLTAITPNGVEVSVEIPSTILEMMDMKEEDFSLELVDPTEDMLVDDDTIQEIAGAFIRLSPDGIVFPVPVVFNIVIPDKIIADNQSAITISLWDEKNNKWQAQQIAINKEDSTTIVQVQLSHFSTYGVYSFPGHPAVSVLEPWTVGKYGKLQFDYSKVTSYRPTETLYLYKDNDTTPVDWKEPTGIKFPWVPKKLLEEGIYTLESEVGDDKAKQKLWSRQFVVGRDEHHEKYAELIERYAPVIQFAENEEWLPVPIDESYFSQVCNGENCPLSIHIGWNNTDVFGVEAMDLMTNYGFQESLLTSRKFFNAGHSVAWEDSLHGNVGNGGVTVYASVHKLSNSKTLVNYWMFYLHDPKIGSGKSWLAKHDRDREVVGVVIDENHTDPVNVIYTGHLPDQMMRFKDKSDTSWKYGALSVLWKNVDRFCTHPVVYIAQGSHAVYPRANDFEIKVNKFVQWISEPAGGGFTYCPPNIAQCNGAGFIQNRYDLKHFPTMDTIDSKEDSSWRHLLFSGGWVDGIGAVNGTFPPFMDQYRDASNWVKKSQSNNNGSGAIEYMGLGTDFAATDSDSDTDIDTDIDTDADSDADTDTDTDTDTSIIDTHYKWHTFYGSDSYGLGDSVATDRDNSILIAGTALTSWNGLTEESPINAHSGNYDAMILKLDQDGSYQWHTFYGGSSYDSGISLAVDDSGNIFIIGSSRESWDGPKGEAPLNYYLGDSNFFILKLNSSGLYQWHAFYSGGDNYDRLRIAISRNQSIFITGVSDSFSWNGPAGEYPLNPYSGYYNVFIIRFSMDGSYYWHSFYPLLNHDTYTTPALDIDSDDNIVLAYSVESYWDGPAGESPLNENISSSEYCAAETVVVKMDKDGSYKWHTFIGGGWDESSSIALDDNGNIYVSGLSLDYFWNGPNNESPLNSNLGKVSAIIFKLSSNGVYKWHTFYGNDDSEYRSSYQYFSSIAVGSDENIFVSGNSDMVFYGSGGEIPLYPYSNSYDVFVLELGTDGEYKQHAFYGGISSDYNFAMTINKLDHIIITGRSYSSWLGPNGEYPLNSYSNEQDLFVLNIE